MMSPAFCAGAFFKCAINALVGHFSPKKQHAVRPSRRPLPARLPNYREAGRLYSAPHGQPQPVPRIPSNHHRRRKHRSQKLHRSASHLAGPSAQRRHCEDSINTIIRRQGAARRRLGSLTVEDAIIGKEWDALQFDKMKRTAFASAAATAARVKANTEKRKQHMAHRNELAKWILRNRSLIRGEQEKRKRVELEEQRRLTEAREAAERNIREARKRAEQEARKREEQEARKREEQEARERAEQEAREREERLAKERAEHDARVRAERLAKENAEFLVREKEARLFQLYMAKWDALKAGIEPNGHKIPPLHFTQIPWPVLSTAPCPADITKEHICKFLLHPMHNVEGKPMKWLAKQELVRWHPDKFNGIVLGKVVPEQQNMVIEGAGQVARILNAIKSEL